MLSRRRHAFPAWKFLFQQFSVKNCFWSAMFMKNVVLNSEISFFASIKKVILSWDKCTVNVWCLWRKYIRNNISYFSSKIKTLILRFLFYVNEEHGVWIMYSKNSPTYSILWIINQSLLWNEVTMIQSWWLLIRGGQVLINIYLLYKVNLISIAYKGFSLKKLDSRHPSLCLDISKDFFM